jgi:hypothetical protein
MCFRSEIKSVTESVVIPWPAPLLNHTRIQPEQQGAPIATVSRIPNSEYSKTGPGNRYKTTGVLR